MPRPVLDQYECETISNRGRCLEFWGEETSSRRCRRGSVVYETRLWSMTTTVDVNHDWPSAQPYEVLAYEKVLVVLDGSRQITKCALEWVLNNVPVPPGECITLVALYSPGSYGHVRRIWGFPMSLQMLGKDCASTRILRSVIDHSRATKEVDEEIYDACVSMIQQFQSLCDQRKIAFNVKVQEVGGQESVATEATKLGATCVVFDRHLKKEAKVCMNLLHCNIVIVKPSESKLLQMNLKQSSLASEPSIPLSRPHSTTADQNVLEITEDSNQPVPLSRNSFPHLKSNTLLSSPEEVMTPFTPLEDSSTSSKSSSDSSPCRAMDPLSNNLVNRGVILEMATGGIVEKGASFRAFYPDIDDRILVPDLLSSDTSPGNVLRKFKQENMRVSTDHSKPLAGSIDIVQSREGTSPSRTRSRDGSRKSSRVNSRRESPSSLESINKREPFESDAPGPPPLCFLCQHKAPCFGKPPQSFSYKELQVATAGFSRSNFLAEGGYGYVHQGILPDGQAIAVKQYKQASTQGDKEFCAEVEVLSCAQHRNVVMLIGFCIEGKRRLLVYEFICNGSLDGHLYGHSSTGEHEKPVLEWSSRYKIALGAARGLRYLHEECRVGCIVHRDLRPNNILLTHDFEPMVGDFGLARWQPDRHCGVETRVIGTFGYLAPEYTQHGQVTDKADVYSFGVVLLELITGRKAIDIKRPKGEQCLTEWARPLLEERGTLPIDPRLENRFEVRELNSMLNAASCCICRDPSVRPRMAEVLKMLEGDPMFSEYSSPASVHFAERLNSNRMNYSSISGSRAQDKVTYPSFFSPQSDDSSTYASPVGNNGNLPFSPMLSSASTKQFLVKDSIRKLPMVSSYIGEDGKGLSYEALRAAYLEKVGSQHLIA